MTASVSVTSANCIHWTELISELFMSKWFCSETSSVQRLKFVKMTESEISQ
jgi:hypothetical protein